MNDNTPFKPLPIVGIVLLLAGIGLAITNHGSTSGTGTSNNAKPVDYEIKEVATGLEVPWAIAFTGENRMLVTERPGRIRIVENNQLLPTPLHTFSDVVSESESGLLGITADPNYARNKYIYTVYTYKDGNTLYDKVVRFTDSGTSLSEEKIIIDKIPAGENHAGSRIQFGPDGHLYVTTGDATTRSIAQNTNNLGGKVLRLNSDGSIPADNPFNNAVWSYGHRNPQGIGWHPVTKAMYESEHGPSGFDGPGGGDEINRIVKGGTYGWPDVSHTETREGTITPLQLWTPAEAPSGLLVYSGKAFPQWMGDIFVGALRGTTLWHLTLDPKDKDKIADREEFPGINYGRIRAVVEDKAGNIYFTTSNRDGRGNAKQGDDKIYVITPKE